ncbi:MAG: hypothetical protein ABI867_32900 [Kofleriaceae bacterium]
MIDLDAAIVPGESAGGFRLGQSVAEVLAEAPKTTEKLANGFMYGFGPVLVWIERKKVTRIGLVEGYHGAIASVRVGCPLAALEALGTISQDSDDNTVVDGLAGVVFDVSKASGKKNPILVRGIYVVPL